MNKCRSCLSTGTFEERTVTYPLKMKGRIVIFENVPALVCAQCHETLFTADIVKKMEALALTERPPSRTEQIPVYDLAEVA